MASRHEGVSVLSLLDENFDDDPTPESRKAFLQLTDQLNATEARLNAFIVPAGEEGPHHHHLVQEEYYILIDGEGGLRVDGEYVSATRGDIFRVEPDVPRKFENHTDATSMWLVIGVPPITHVDDEPELVYVD